jgi:3-oxoacyl-[acyl-carrier protein] reductase
MPYTADAMQGLRTLVVGGGGGGIGAAITEALAAAGAELAVVDVDPARAGAAAESAAKYGHAAVPITANIRDVADIERLVTEARESLGGIDVLVTVVGGLMAFGTPFDRLDTFTDENWDDVFDVNLRYVHRVLRATLRVMLEQGTGGTIVSIGSDAGTANHGSPNAAAYGAAKSALAHLAMSVACEYGKDGIRMNIVSPSATETSATSALSPEMVKAMVEAIPLRRRGKPEDIANAVVYFASPLSRQVTGQVLGVDGGVSVESPMPDLSDITRRAAATANAAG